MKEHVVRECGDCTFRYPDDWECDAVKPNKRCPDEGCPDWCPLPILVTREASLPCRYLTEDNQCCLWLIGVKNFDCVGKDECDSYVPPDTGGDKA